MNNIISIDGVAGQGMEELLLVLYGVKLRLLISFVGKNEQISFDGYFCTLIGIRANEHKFLPP